MNKLRVLDLFSGIGGFSLGLERTGGFETVAFCEIEEYPRRVLAKHWPDVPIYRDVRDVTKEQLTADGIAVDVITGGFPCQDISAAGKQLGIKDGTRSGLWSEIARLVGELQPRYVIVENVSNLLSGPSEQRGGWFGRVLGDLASVGYDAERNSIRAARVGLPQVRDRVWLIAYPECERRERLINDDSVFSGTGTPHAISLHRGIKRWHQLGVCFSDIRNRDGLPPAAHRRRLKSLGNAVVPQIPEMIGRAILEVEAAA